MVTPDLRASPRTVDLYACSFAHQFFFLLLQDNLGPPQAPVQLSWPQRQSGGRGLFVTSLTLLTQPVAEGPPLPFLGPGRDTYLVHKGPIVPAVAVQVAIQ